MLCEGRWKCPAPPEEEERAVWCGQDDAMVSVPGLGAPGEPVAPSPTLERNGSWGVLSTPKSLQFLLPNSLWLGGRSRSGPFTSCSHLRFATLRGDTDLRPRRKGPCHRGGEGRGPELAAPLTPPAAPTLRFPSSAEGRLAPVPPLMSGDENNSSHQICIG